MSHRGASPGPGPDAGDPGVSGYAAAGHARFREASAAAEASVPEPGAARIVGGNPYASGPPAPDPHDVGAAVRIGVGVLVRRLRAMKAEEGDLTLPESAALTRLDRAGPATAAALARAEQISPQAMGATLAALEARGLITREPDPEDGRRLVLSVSAEGLEVLRHRRSRRTRELADALAEGFTADELRTLLAAAPLLERLADRL